MKAISWISSGALILTYILGSQVFADANPEVAINEVAWAGSFASSSDEWIELYNPGAESKDISGWQLTKNTGTESIMVTIPPASSIEAGGYFVISNFAAAGSVLASEPTLVDPAITLSNTQLQIKLYKGSFSDPANLVDTAGDGGVPLAGSNTTKSSMERTQDLSGWQDSSERENLDAGAQELGTPAAKNSTISMPPTLMSVSPNAVELGDELMVDEIIGTNFAAGLALELRREGQSIVGGAINVASAELIDAVRFDTNSATVGKWDLVLINPDGLQATLAEAINIESPPPQYDLATTIRINEVYPAPNSGQEEFIELYNFGDKAVSLMGWKIDDIPNGGSAPHTISALTILPNKFLVITKSQSHLTLNDTGDSVSLLQPSGLELDKVIFTEATKGSSWGWFDNENKWTTTVTPNGINVFTQKAEEDTEVPVAEEEEETVRKYKVGDVTINELLPNPDENEEFIELQNNTSESLNLEGWYLKDASGKKYTIKNSLLLKPGQLLVIYAEVSGIALNNSGGEEVKLFDPTHQVIDTVNYVDKAPVNVAYALDSKDWVWTAQATPGKPNQIEVNEIEDTTVLAETVEEEILPVTGSAIKPWMAIMFVLFGALGILSWHRYAKKNYPN